MATSSSTIPSVDSRQYVQNAIDALYDAGGGTLIIPTGTWYLNSYGVPDKIANYGGNPLALSR
jgi:hypothetical protein